MTKSKSNGKKKRTLTARSAIEQFIDEKFAVLKRTFSMMIQQHAEKVDTFKDDIGTAKHYSLIVTRIQFDMAAGRDIKLIEGPYGKVPDQEYYLRMMRAIGDTEAFIAGKTVSEEEMDQAEAKIKNNSFKEKLNAWIALAMRQGCECGMKKAKDKSEDALIEFVKSQRVGLSWEDEMDQFVSEVYKTNTEKLVKHRKTIAKDTIGALLMDNGVGFKNSNGFESIVKRGFLKRISEGEDFLWSDDIKDWIPEIVVTTEDGFEKDAQDMLDKAEKMSSKWGGEYSEAVSEIRQFVLDKEYKKAIGCYGILTDKVGRRSHKERISVGGR